MGMFTSIIDPVTNIEYQIKCGYDDCEKFNVGDKVPAYIVKEYPNQGYLLDDVYDGCAYSQEDAWVIIKDATIVAIEPRTYPEDDAESDYTRLTEKYQIKQLPRNTWSEETWKAKEELEAKYKKENDEWKQSIAHLSPHERLVETMAKPIRDGLKAKSMARKLFSIEPELSTK